MKFRLKLFTSFSMITVLSLLPVVHLATSSARAQEVIGGAALEQEDSFKGLSPEATQQIEDLLAEKEMRSPLEQKIDSRLLVAIKEQSASADIDLDENGLTAIDISASRVTTPLQQKINESGVIIAKSAKAVRAKTSLEDIVKIAALSEVNFIQPAVEAMTQKPASENSKLTNQNAGYRSEMPLTLADRKAHVRAQLSQAFASNNKNSIVQNNTSTAGQPIVQQQSNGVTGSFVSQGDATHRAAEARAAFNVTGSGVKIGVLSDSVDHLRESQAAGELPYDVTVLPGQAGSGAGEGTAMLEIIHDLAPGAKLYFATAFAGDASFADNIRALRRAGCDIIVDDVFYFNELPFQDGVIARAVNDVTADGALYFSSAGNGGNRNKNRSGVWEGDFANGGSLTVNLPSGPVTYAVHDFGAGNTTDQLLGSGSGYALFWSDPEGASSNDYDLFLLNSAGTQIKAFSTNVQNGSPGQTPYEFISRTRAASGDRLLIAKRSTAATRALHLDMLLNGLGGLLRIATNGQTHGHNSAVRAFGVAATPAAAPFTTAIPSPAGPFPNPFNSTNQVELFSSDGLRRIFYNADGTPITPGNLLFSTNGGTVRQKPDITAADGVATSVPGFQPFFGTSAAAPHAAAIAGLLKSGNRSLTQEQVRQILTSTAIDIEAPGVDRDSGYGILSAFSAISSSQAQPIQASPASLGRSPVSVTSISGNDNAFIEPGESAELTIPLRNFGGVTATNVQATLTTSTPGVVISQATSTYRDIARETTANNDRSFVFALSNDAPCGLNVEFTLTVTYSGGESPLVTKFSVATGKPGSISSTTSYTGPAAPIPDNSDQGVEIPLRVSGFNGRISNLKFRFDGTNCTTQAGATTVGLDHTYVGDLVIFLTSPRGTTVTLANQAGGAGQNFCQTTFDDGAPTSIQDVAPSAAPFTGSYRPAGSLSAFNNEDPNGVWTLSVFDIGPGDTGNVRAFSLVVTPFACDLPVQNGRLAVIGRENNRWSVSTINSDGSRLQTVSQAPQSAFDYDTPQYSPDRTQIAWLRYTFNDYEPNLYVSNVDGSNQRKLSLNNAYTFAWSPDSRSLAFTAYEGGRSKLFAVDADGSNLRVITDQAGPYAPSWSPDKLKIAFRGYDGQRSQIYVINADGSGLQNISNNTTWEANPLWSPDGRRIAYKTFDPSAGLVTGDIWVMNADGSGKANVSKSGDAYSHDWSPTGREIAFLRWQNQRPDVYIANADGSGSSRRASTTSGVYGGPAWSPDGSRLVFTSGFDIYLVNSDGSNQRKITNIAGPSSGEYFVNW